LLRCYVDAITDLSPVFTVAQKQTLKDLTTLIDNTLAVHS